ncbi:unnamed protein product [Diamesa serratosioi]
MSQVSLNFRVNKISTLSDFEDCPNLQELYLRKNNIQEINDLVYLQNLTKLKFLWLEENPCVDSAGPNYRKIVLRALPKLIKLDNVEVTPEEVQDALRNPPAAEPQKKEDVYEEEYDTTYQQQPTTQFRGHSPVREPMQQSPEVTESECTSDPNDRQSSLPTSPLQRSPQNQDSYSPAEPNHTSSPQRHPPNRGQYNNQSYEQRSLDESPNVSYRERAPMSSSMSTHSMKDYNQGEYQQRTQPPANYRHSQQDLTEWDENQSQQNGNHPQNGHNGTREYQQSQRRSMISNGGSQERYNGNGETRERGELYQYRNGNVSREDFGEEVDRRRETVRRAEGRFNDNNSVISNAVLNHLAGLHRRPVNRSSNLLSATLCLVKELDYSSLEVVEHAVRCRIDELAETL